MFKGMKESVELCTSRAGRFILQRAVVLYAKGEMIVYPDIPLDKNAKACY